MVSFGGTLRGYLSQGEETIHAHQLIVLYSKDASPRLLLFQDENPRIGYLEGLSGLPRFRTDYKSVIDQIVDGFGPGTRLHTIHYDRVKEFGDSLGDGVLTPWCDAVTSFPCASEQPNWLRFFN